MRVKLLLLLLIPQLCFADERFSTANPAFFRHAHEQGSWMLEYKSTFINMRNLLTGDTELTPEQVISQGYTTAPVEMTAANHKLMSMYGFSDNLTGMIVAQFHDKQMVMQNATAVQTTMNASGLGDTQLGILFKQSRQLVLSLMLSIPTGSVEVEQNATRLPYNMQLGSGTLDFIPALTYSAYLSDFGWGIESKYIARGNHNDSGYRLGNRAKVETWGTWLLTTNWTNSFRLNYEWWDAIDGVDSAIDTGSPTGRVDLQEGQRMELGLGFSYLVRRRHLLGLELDIPLLQNLKGPQLQSESSLNFVYKILFQQ